MVILRTEQQFIGECGKRMRHMTLGVKFRRSGGNCFLFQYFRERRVGRQDECILKLGV